MDLPEKFPVPALLAAWRIQLGHFPTESATAITPMLSSHGNQGYVALFRYGVVVFVNISPLEQQHLLDQTLCSYIEEQIEEGEEESIEVIIFPDHDERVQGERINLHERSIPRLQILLPW